MAASSSGYFRTNIYTGEQEFVPHPEHRYERLNEDTGEVEASDFPQSRVKKWQAGATVCDASGIDESQVPEHREYLRKHGYTGIEVNNDGQMVYRSRKQRAHYLRREGMYDRNGGYGDAQTRNR